MIEDFSSIDFRFVVNTGANHPDVWYVDKIVISQVGDPQRIPTWDLTIPSLAKAYEGNFLFGNIIEPNQLDSKTTNMDKSYYNVTTPENAMKPNSISTAKGVYNFPGADSTITRAQQNGIKVHGHTLVWHSQSPNWLYKNTDGTPLTRSEARQNHWHRQSRKRNLWHKSGIQHQTGGVFIDRQATYNVTQGTSPPLTIKKVRNGGIFDGRFIIKPQNLEPKQHFYR